MSVRSSFSLTLAGRSPPSPRPLGASGSPVDADSLDEQLVLLLVNNCANLEFDQNRESFAAEPLRDLRLPGDRLRRLLGRRVRVPQASALSIRNSLVGRRLERAKGKRGDGESASLRGLFRAFLGNAQVEGRPPRTIPRRPPLRAVSTSSPPGRTRASIATRRRSSPGSTPPIAGGAVGADYRFSDTVVAGLVAGYRKHEGDFAQGGDFEMTAFEPTVYVSVLPSPKTFLQFVAGYAAPGRGRQPVRPPRARGAGHSGHPDHRGFVASATDASIWSGGAQFGSDHAAGSFTYGPRVGVNYSRTTIDPYAESGATGLELVVTSGEVESLQGVAGFYGSVAVSAVSGVWLPQFGVEYVHEFEDDASVRDARFARTCAARSRPTSTTSRTPPTPTSSTWRRDRGGVRERDPAVPEPPHDAGERALRQLRGHDRIRFEL